MQCFNCNEETNPTLIYCQNCGVPLDTDVEDLVEDEERKRAESRQIEAKHKAKKLMVLALFLFGATVGVRFAILKKQTYDYFPAYRVPYRIVEEAGLEAPVALEVDSLTIPLPKSEGE